MIKPKRKLPYARLSPVVPINYDALMAANFKFNRDDLEYNRLGIMAQGQAQRKFLSFFSDSWFTTLVTIVIFPAMTFMLIAMMFGFFSVLHWAFIETTEQARPETFLGAGVLGLIWLGYTAQYLTWFYNAIHICIELQHGIVDYTAGRVTITKATGKYDEDKVWVGGKAFRMANDAKKKIKVGESYIFYHLPKTHVILSAEPLEIPQ